MRGLQAVRMPCRISNNLRDEDRKAWDGKLDDRTVEEEGPEGKEYVSLLQWVLTTYHIHTCLWVGRKLDPTVWDKT